MELSKKKIIELQIRDHREAVEYLRKDIHNNLVNKLSLPVIDYEGNQAEITVHDKELIQEIYRLVSHDFVKKLNKLYDQLEELS